MFVLGFVILAASTVGSFWPYINAYGYKRLLPFRVQILIALIQEDTDLMRDGEYYEEHGQLTAWEKRMLAHLASQWTFDASGGIKNDSMMWAFKYLTEDREKVADRLLAGIGQFPGEPYSAVASILQLTSDPVRRVHQLFDVAKSGSPDGASAPGWLYNSLVFANRINNASSLEVLDAYLDELLALNYASELDRFRSVDLLRQTNYPIERVFARLENVSDTTKLTTGARVIVELLRSPESPESAVDEAFSGFLKIAARADDDLAYAIGRHLASMVRRKPELAPLGRLEQLTKAETIRERFAALIIVELCVDPTRFEAFVETALAVAREIDTPQARTVVANVLRHIPVAERGPIFRVLSAAPESMSIWLIDALPSWFPDDPRATVAIRERLYDPNSSDAVKQAAFAALKRLNALGPSDSLPSGLWRSP
jgi:hypothetical protein